MANNEKFSVSSVKLLPIKPPESGELCELIHRKCSFCEKDCVSLPVVRRVLEKLAGPNRFFCPFCVRYGAHTKNSRNILLLSFRGIIGYFYYHNHLTPISKRMYLADIEDYIDAHAEAGSLNPVFTYDQESFMWFVDFSKVGNSKRKVPVEDVLHTILDILACFNLAENIPGINRAGFYAKYQEAIKSFYERRYRPPDKKALIPTFSGCLHGQEKTSEKVRTFASREMYAKIR